MYHDEDLSQDNGSPAFFGILLGTIEIVVGLTKLAIWAWRKR